MPKFLTFQKLSLKKLGVSVATAAALVSGITPTITTTVAQAQGLNGWQKVRAAIDTSGGRPIVYRFGA